MPVEIIWDPVDGARASASIQGWEIERKCIVTGLTPAPDILVEAVNAALAHAGYGGIGAAYGYLPLTFLEEWQPALRAGTQDTVDISFIFRQLVPEMTTDIGTSLSQETSCYDKDGNLVEVTYTPTGSTTVKPQKVPFPKLIPESTLVITRLELVSPGPVSRTYVGRVNSGGWSRDPGAPARTWLCMAIVGQNRGTGVFLVTYTFAYRADTWDEDVFYLDPKTGRIPGDIVEGTGIKRIKKYAEINFDGLVLGA